MINFSIWDLKEEFFLAEAACLWLEVNPYDRDLDKQTNSDIWGLIGILLIAGMHGKLNGFTPFTETVDKAFPQFSKITRDGLIEYAKSVGQKPKFLFPAERENKQSKFKHSPDFRSVTIPSGEVFTLTTQQAQVIECLYNAYINEAPDVSGAYIFESINSNIAEQNLKKAFFKRHNRIYEALIESKKKGAYRLKVE